MNSDKANYFSVRKYEHHVPLSFQLVALHPGHTVVLTPDYFRPERSGLVGDGRKQDVERREQDGKDGSRSGMVIDLDRGAPVHSRLF